MKQRRDFRHTETSQNSDPVSDLPQHPTALVPDLHASYNRGLQHALVKVLKDQKIERVLLELQQEAIFAGIYTEAFYRVRRGEHSGHPCGGDEG